MRKLFLTIGMLCLLGCMTVVAPVCAGTSDLDVLKQLSLEELTNIEVTSVSRNRERLADAAAAVCVITSEDLRRGGFTTIAEALRLVPGMQVAHINASQWAISSRGGNAWFANKLLVLIDGRQVYTPLFSGVFWDVQDTMLEDIDRIEVIRGPGAALWGSNAVNGVINIVTRRAEETQGLLVSGGAGDRERGFGAIRFGTKAGEQGWLRGYLKYFSRDHFDAYNGLPDKDDWRVSRGGFRGDWQLAGEDHLTLQGDIYEGDIDSRVGYFDPEMFRKRIYNSDTDVSGGNILGRWRHEMAEAGSLSLQMYYDRTVRDVPILAETRDTWDVDFQHSLPTINRHQLTWGLGFHFTHDDTDGCKAIYFDPDSRGQYLASAFVQDRFSLIEGCLVLTLGSKFEYNQFSGFEIQPNLRLGWTPMEGQFFWASVSRAVRTPSRSERDVVAVSGAFPTGPIINYLAMVGSNDLDSEELLSYEAGWRSRFGSCFSLDVSAFYNIYHDLRGKAVDAFMAGHGSAIKNGVRILPLHIDNLYDEDVYGFEISANFTPVEWWRLNCSYSRLKIDLHSGVRYPAVDIAEGNSPEHSLALCSYLDLPANFEFDTMFFYVDKLDNEYLDVPSYSRFDCRLGWHPRADLELSFKVENLFERRHEEYDFIDVVPTQVPRSFFGKVTWKF